jgi:hypothetical protein
MRGTAFGVLALVMCASACSGEKEKRFKSRREAALAREEAILAAKSVKTEPPKPAKVQMTPEQFAQAIGQPFGDTEVSLADPSGVLFRSPARRWERELRFDPSNAAFDKASGQLYGVSRDGRDLVSLDVRTGVLRRRVSGCFVPVPRKVDPKKILKAEYQQSQEPVFERVGEMLVVAQNLWRRGDYTVQIVGLHAGTGRLVWKKRLPNLWKEGFSLWSEGGLAFLGDSSSGPIYLFDAKTGGEARIEYPKDGTYVFGGSDGLRVVFYYARPNGELYLVGHDAQGKVLWRQPLSECFPNKAYFQPFVNVSVLPCKAKTSAKEHLDRVLKISLADGQILWQTDALRRPGDPLKDAQRPDLISLRKGADGATYYRNRFGFARIEPDGRLAWSYPLHDKEIYILVGDEPYRSENVMGGDEPYEEVVSLDPATGKPRWRYSEEAGLPARGVVREGTLLMWGFHEIRALATADGRLLARVRTPQRLEGIAFQGGVLYADTAGVRRAIRLSDQKLLLHDRSEDETIVNNWLDLGPTQGLLLYHDDHHRLTLVEPVVDDMRVPLPRDRLRKVRLLTPPAIEIDGLRWIDASTLEVTSPDDERLWRLPADGGTPTAVVTRRKGAARYGRGGVAFLGDPTKVQASASLKLERDGRQTVISESPAGEFFWSSRGTELVFAERRESSIKSQHFKVADFVVRIFDARRDASRDVLLVRGADATARLGSASFGPGGTLTVVVENLYGNHFVGTFSTAGRVTGEMKVDDEEGTVAIRIPGNRAPTQRLGVDAGDFFGEVGWSGDGTHLATLRGQRLQILTASGREVFSRPEAAVSIFRWAPTGASLYYVKDGNLWRWSRGRLEQLSFFLFKREPRNEEEVKLGNLPRFLALEVSPDGRRLALGLRFPEDGNTRLAVLDL